MRQSTEKLIERLVADARPVRRLRPPTVRALLWLVAVGAVVGLLVYIFADMDMFLRRAQDTRLTVELMATLLTGIAAAVAAFQLSQPDRSPKWVFLPVPTLALWIAVSGYGCYRYWLDFGSAGGEIDGSANCFAFILAASVPLGASLLLLLRRAAPLAPIPVAAAGGLSVAAIAAFALQFFHPFDITFIDLSVHAAAVMIVIAAASFAGWLRSRHPSPLP